MSDKLPPVDGMEYPEKPEDPSMTEIMQHMERVDAYWSRRGRKQLETDDEPDE